MKNPNHPIWSLIRLLILMIAMCVILYINATHFDITEIRSIIGIFIAAASAEGISQFFKKE